MLGRARGRDGGRMVPRRKGRSPQERHPSEKNKWGRTRGFSLPAFISEQPYSLVVTDVLSHMEDTKGQTVTKAVARDCTKAW